MEKRENVAVLGASSNPERYSNMAVRMLTAHGHRVIPVNPALKEVEGLPCRPGLNGVEKRIDTLTVYLKPALTEPMIDDIVALRPGRVILNPGSESEPLEAALRKEGIAVERACTLVLLRTGQY